MLAYAQNLVYSLRELMPTQYQKENLEAMLALFLSAQGHPLPEHSQTKSASAFEDAINQDDKYYCSQGCAEGHKTIKGCNHQGCGC